jgi:hypothetical protein
VVAEPLADLPAVAGRIKGGITEGDEDLVWSLIRDASALVRAEFSDVDVRIEAGTLDADDVAGVVAGVVKRIYLSPGDMVESETVGPFGVRYRDGMFLRATDRAILGVGATGAVTGARSVRMGY